MAFPSELYFDIVVLDSNGDITLVECKLAKNPEGRREMIGQLFDYAARLWRMGLEDFEFQWLEDSWTAPPMLSFTSFAVSSSMMSFASLSEHASRSSLATTKVSPLRHAARASRRPGRARLVPVRPWSV